MKCFKNTIFVLLLICSGNSKLSYFKYIAANGCGHILTDASQKHTSMGGIFYMENWKNLNIDNIDGEIWRPIKGYEDLYEVSNLGRIKSMERFETGNGYGEYNRKPIIKKQNFGTNGYLCTILTKNKIKKTFSIHRTVAVIFIDNPNNKRCVNHRDGDKTNNSVDNLEWCTHSENMYHAFKNGLARNKKGGENKSSKKVKQLDFDNNVIAVYDSVAEAAAAIGLKNQSQIGSVCAGYKYRKTAGGFKWEYL